VADLVRESLERLPFDGVQNLRLYHAEAQVDPSQSRQVVLNLVTNAIQAMPEGGTLSVCTRLDGEAAVIVVEDTGTGMSPEILGKIFQPLFTTKARGIGLGLAVTEQLVRANSGTIRAVSDVGKGSRFIVAFPINGE